MCFQGIWQQNEPDFNSELKGVNFKPLNSVIGKKKFDLMKCKTQLKNEIRINPTFEIRKTAPHLHPIVSVICDASELRNFERTNQVLSWWSVVIENFAQRRNSACIRARCDWTFANFPAMPLVVCHFSRVSGILRDVDNRMWRDRILQNFASATYNKCDWCCEWLIPKKI